MNAYRFLVENPEGKRPFGTRRCRWKDHIDKDLKEVAWVGMDWVHMAVR
jgi:hypothetical protein